MTLLEPIALGIATFAVIGGLAVVVPQPLIWFSDWLRQRGERRQPSEWMDL